MTAKQLFPKEHGTWAMLLVPWIVGCGVARAWNRRELLLLLATLMFFLAQNQIMNWLRLRFASVPNPAAMQRVRNLFLIFSGVGILAVIPLLERYHLTGLVYFGLIAVVLTALSMMLVNRKMDRSLLGQFLAAAGLSLSAPLAYYVATGYYSRIGLELWGINFLFFLGGVFYVQMKIDALSHRTGFQSLASRFGFAAKTLAFDWVILLAVFLILEQGLLSPWATVALVPTAIQALVGAARLDHPAKLKRVGILSTMHSILFAALLIWLA